MMPTQAQIDAMNETIREADRVELVGSEKQIEWAMDIRRKFAIGAKSVIRDVLAKPELAQAVKDEAVVAHAQIMATADAKWWIDNARASDSNNLIVKKLRENRAAVAK